MPESGSTARNLRGLDRFVGKCMSDWRVHGCAVAVVKADRVLHARGYGIGDAKLGLPVVERTRFFTASFGKTFTATLAAILVDEGRVAWDAPVREYVPAFRMADPEATAQATLRDFLSHRTGMGSHDRMWINTELTRDEVLERLHWLEPRGRFRSGFQYTNLNYLVAGAILERVTGESWEQMMRSRVLEPAGMGSSFLLSDTAAGQVDIATGYELSHNRVLPYLRSFRSRWRLSRILGPCGPAGSVFSNLGDLCRYVRMQMGGGRLGTRRIVSETNLGETHRRHMLWPGLGNGRELPDAFYGMGWLVQPYRGFQHIYSGGNGCGFGCRVGFFPGESLGVVVLTNQARTHMMKVIAHYIYDRMLGLSPARWNSRYLVLVNRTRSEPRLSAARRRESTGLRRCLEDFAGVYDHPAYGRVTVALRGGRLRLWHNGFPFRVDHDQDDTFTISVPTGYTRRARFEADDRGRVVSVAVPFAEGVADIVFVRSHD